MPVEIVRHEGAPSIGPLGTKGAGEIPILNVAVAVGCAVACAIGRPVQEPPLTPPRVLDRLLNREGRLDLSHIAASWRDNILGPNFL